MTLAKPLAAHARTKPLQMTGAARRLFPTTALRVRPRQVSLVFAGAK